MGEKTFCHDELLEGGTFSQMTNGTNYREVRQYVTEYHHLKFYFITRCYSDYMEQILTELKNSPVKPDVLLLNSCLWDITRYGNVFVKTYKENLVKLMERLQASLPEKCLVVWNCTLPISKEAKGGVLIPECEAMNSTLRLDLIQANHLAAKIVQEAGYDVLDFQFYLRHQLHRRAEDGIHWDMTAHRRFTNLIMTHVAEAWGCDLPNNSSMVNSSLVRTLQSAISDDLITPKARPAPSSRPIAKAKRRIPRAPNAFRNGNKGNQWQNQQKVRISQPDRPFNRPIRNNVVQDYNSNIFRNPGQHYGNQVNGSVHDSVEIFNNPVQHCRQIIDGPVPDKFVFDHQVQQNSSYSAAVEDWERRFSGQVHNNFLHPRLEQNNFAEQPWKPVGNTNFHFMQCSEKLEHNGPVKLFGDPHFHNSASVNPIFQQELPIGPNEYGLQNFNNMYTDNTGPRYGINYDLKCEQIYQTQPVQQPAILNSDRSAHNYGLECEQIYQSQRVQQPAVLNSDSSAHNYGLKCEQIYQSQRVQQLGFLSHLLNSDSSAHHSQPSIRSITMIHTEFDDENAGIMQKQNSAFGFESHTLNKGNRALKDKNIFSHQKQFRAIGNGYNPRRHNPAQRPQFLIAPQIRR